MLFKTQFHEGIRNGSIALTFRAWKSVRAKVGKQYRFGPEEGVEADAVDEVGVSAIDAEEAHRSGFTSATELRDFLIKHSTTFTSKSTVFRVPFIMLTALMRYRRRIFRLQKYKENLKKWTA